ncbi:MAG TPA: hypothetical protein VE640_04945 [Candidatus Bathyarchaeia archaeon]|nr:hypothetical protein [Candidatus Bathyarchaeia archaeon]
MSRGARSGWIPGFVVGVAAGFATLEFPTLGWLLVIVFAIIAAILGPRIAAIAGLLTGLGTIWLLLLGHVAVSCQATGSELGCHAPDIQPWLVAGGTMLAAGVALTLVAFGRARRDG